jgi:hypothetical protein
LYALFFNQTQNVGFYPSAWLPEIVTMRGEVCAAGLLLFEHIRAIGLKEAIKHAGGVAEAGGFVAPDLLQALEAALEAAKQSA